MSRSRLPNRQSRLSRFEEFEKRLVMSAQAVASVLPDFDGETSNLPSVDQVEVSTFAQSQSQASAISPTTAAAEIGASYGLDGTGQTIAIIDTGIAFDHIALGGGFGEGHRVVGGYDFAEDDANPFDDGSLGFHGTHVAGIIGSSDSTFQGVASGADLVALRVFDDAGTTQLEWIEQSLQWVSDNINTFENPITTVNLSLGTSPGEIFLEVLNDELQALEEQGIFISVAAGNSFEQADAGELAYPASSEFVVPVASHNSEGQISEFSQRASHVLTAPGENITSTVPDHLFFGARSDSFLGTSGTSQAAPYVAGASALLRQANLIAGVTDIDQDLLYSQFISTADSIFDEATNQTYSQINLEAAIESVLGGVNLDQPATPTNADVETQPNQVDQPEQFDQADQIDQVDQSSQANEASASFNLDQGNLTIFGTSANDRVDITSGDDDRLTVTVNGQSQRFNLTEIDSIVFDGQQGEDAVEVNLSGTDDQVTLVQNRIEIRNEQFSLVAHGIEDAVVNNGGGNDQLFVGGSQFDDVVKASGKSVLFTNEQFAASGGAFQTALVLGDVGSDLIELEGSADADRFSHGENGTFFRTQQLELIARGFENASANGNGGADVANLNGTSASETFDVDQNSAEVSGGDSNVSINGFESINVLNSDSNDQVTLAGSDGDDRLFTRDNSASLISDGFSNYVSNISNLTVTASAGDDAAYLAGTAGDDHLSHTADSTTLENADGKISVEGYDLVVARPSEGNDTANFVGSDQRESYFANGDTFLSIDSAGNRVRVIGFDETNVDGGGGDDSVTLRGGESDDSLRVNFDNVEFETTLQMLRLTNVENSKFDGGGGHDRVELNEVQNLDLLSSIGETAEAVLRNHTATFTDVDEVEANAVDSALAAYDLESVDFEYNLNGNWFDRDVLGI